MAELTCPRDGLPLEPGREGARACPRCKGRLVRGGELDAGFGTLLAEERCSSSSSPGTDRSCPECHRAMVPWRVGQLDVWVERCTECDLAWVETSDAQVLRKQKRHRLAARTYARLSPTEKRELRRDLAAKPDPPEISPGALQSLLAALGLPVVLPRSSMRTPWLTWSLVLASLLLFTLGGPGEVATRLDVQGAQPVVDGDLGRPGCMTLLISLYLLLAFGDGVEQRLPRPAMLLAFLGGTLLAATVQPGALPSVLALWASSGGVPALIGACLVLLPRSRVAIGIYFHVLCIPLRVFGVLALLFLVLRADPGTAGVPETASLAGLTFGVAFAAASRRFPRDLRPR